MGDRVLQAFAGLLHESCRTAAIGAALGPDGPVLTASFGVAEHRPPDAWRDLLDRGEAALARAKRAGRNRCEVA